MMETHSEIQKHVLLSDAVQAIRQGQKSQAREMLAGILREEPQNEHAYIWSAAIAETTEEAVRCLEKVLRLNPENRLAANTLAAQRLQPRQATGPTPVVSQPVEKPAPAVSARPMNLSVPAAPSIAAIHPKPETPPIPAQRPGLAAPRTSFQAELADQTLECSLCNYERKADRLACPACGAAYSIHDLAKLRSSGNKVNERLIEECIRKWKQRLKEETTFEAYMSIALGHLNLNRSGEALPYLWRAWALRTQDARLRQFNDELAARKLILVVDDSATVRRMVSITLEKQGHRVRTAVDGLDGLTKFTEEIPDLVLLDITMPEMDGYELCRMLRRNLSAKGMPILMLSGKDGFFDKVRGKMAGATDYLTKPFHNDVLVRALDKFLKTKKVKSGLYQLSAEADQ